MDRVLGNTLGAGKGHRYQAGGVLGGLCPKLAGAGVSKEPDQQLRGCAGRLAVHRAPGILRLCKQVLPEQ